MLFLLLLVNFAGGSLELDFLSTFCKVNVVVRVHCNSLVELPTVRGVHSLEVNCGSRSPLDSAALFIQNHTKREAARAVSDLLSVQGVENARILMMISSSTLETADFWQYLEGLVAIHVQSNSPPFPEDLLMRLGFDRVNASSSLHRTYIGNGRHCAPTPALTVRILSLDNRERSDPFVRSTFAINSFYARKHSYRFEFLHVHATNVGESWCKLLMLHNAVRSAIDRTLFVVLDSDAHFTAMETSLVDWVLANAPSMLRESWSILLSRESAVPGKFATPQPFNAGIHYVYVNPDDKSRVKDLLDALAYWFAAVRSSCKDMTHGWPVEQGCLQRLLPQSQLLQSVIHIAPHHMNVWNGPWGRFVRHLWSGIGHELRPVFVSDMIARYLINETAEFEHSSIHELHCSEFSL
jgi:hypothetical protein